MAKKWNKVAKKKIHKIVKKGKAKNTKKAQKIEKKPEPKFNPADLKIPALRKIGSVNFYNLLKSAYQYITEHDEEKGYAEDGKSQIPVNLRKALKLPSRADEDDVYLRLREWSKGVKVSA